MPRCAFHVMLDAPALDSRVCRVVTGLRDAATPYVIRSLPDPAHMTGSNPEQFDIVTLLWDGDATAAGRKLAAHLEGTVTALARAGQSG